MHEHAEGLIRTYTHNGKEYSCLILKHWHLKYKGVYPTYKVELLTKEIPADLEKILIVPETSLK